MGEIVMFWLDLTDLGPVLCALMGTHQPDSGGRMTAFKREPSRAVLSSRINAGQRASLCALKQNVTSQISAQHVLKSLPDL